ncbi:hypothetical protein ONE63_003016 [Megalurothrips usitatus]|uniref:Protein-lysine N-methyltransferase ONE63_003016 n=1 Tax=Megalurothrips usitatus TaxID=439358 RepID=A0AAV7XD08_9NEOP|nr:hypothetical protein ONE63_003016 [Megalurothrips usitatus]
MADSDPDDEVPALPADTLAILQQFQQEQLERQRQLEALENGGPAQDAGAADIEIQEDWQLSQFWYDDHTASTLAKEALRCAGDKGRIALVSCPTLYKPLLRLKGPECTVKLLEFDKRFSVYGENFTFYDYNTPTELPEDLTRSFDVVVADPPFLSPECLSKVALTIQLLSRGKIILCTGAVMQQLAESLLHLRKCQFVPHHKNNLGNEFACYANYELDSFLS